MLKILVLEDNARERAFLCRCIRQILSECQIYEAEDGAEALRLSAGQEVDVFFIDVELPGLVNGFQFAKQIRGNECYALTPIVFATGRRENSLKIHKQYHHYEYLSKPFDMETIRKAVGPLLLNLRSYRLQEAETAGGRRKVILLESGKEQILILADDILFVEKERRTLRVVAKENKIYSDIRVSLEDFISKTVGVSHFVQCHKSYALNLNNVTGLVFEKRGLWQVQFNAPASVECFVSGTYHSDILQWLSRYAEGSGTK